MHYLLDSCHVTAWSRCHMTCWLGSSHSSHHPAKFVAMRLVEVKIKHFWFVTWPHNRSITWLCRSGSLILSHHPVQFDIQRRRESGNITFFIYQLTTWLCWCGPFILIHQAGDNGVYNISSNSNSNSNAEVCKWPFLLM